MPLLGGRKRKQRLEDAGVTGTGQVVSVRDTGVTINQNPRVALTLEITPPDGAPPFTLETKQTVSRVHIPREGDAFAIRYDPDDHDNFVIGGPVPSAAQAVAALDAADAGTIAAAVHADSSGVKRGSAAELLATGKRMTGVLREFSDTGRTVGESSPGAVDPDDSVYVFKIEIPLELGSPIESVFMHRVPMGKASLLGIGQSLNIAVNPANPTREVAIDWETSPAS